jgi:hypothetical protein
MLIFGVYRRLWLFGRHNAEYNSQSFIDDNYPEIRINFLNFLVFAFPISLLLILVSWVLLVVIWLPRKYINDILMTYYCYHIYFDDLPFNIKKFFKVQYFAAKVREKTKELKYYSDLNMPIFLLQSITIFL